jgi:raffinose/stachyose/melibiose transport system permease protein
MLKTPKRYFVLFVLPTLAAFAIAFLIPFFRGIYLSFTKFNVITNTKWVGFENYVKAFTDDTNFLNALFFTVKFTVVSVITINVIAFALALLLTRAIKGTNVFRTVFFMPNLIGGIVLGYIWQMIINGFLIRLGVDISCDASYGFWGLVILMNWQQIGYMMIIYIAGIQNISPELLEAAKIDGAKSWQSLRKVIIPIVMPSITICTFLTLSNSFKLFDQNLALTNGMPAKQSSMLALDIFDTFYGRDGYGGVGQAKAVVFFIIVGLIAFINLRLTRRKEVEM